MGRGAHRTRLRGREAGESTIEHFGTVVVVTLVVVALVVAMVAFGLGDRVAATLCQILPGTSCEGPAAVRSAEDRIPPQPCVVHANGGAVRGSVAAAVQVDGGYTWYIEELGDGRRRLTRTTEEGVGVPIGAGFDVSAVVNDKRYGLALTAGASASLAMRAGDVFYTDSDDEASALLAATVTDDVKDSTIGDDWFGRDVVDWITGASSDEQVEPDSTFVKAGVDLNGSAGATLLTMDASGDAAASAYLGQTQYKDGRVTELFTASGEASVQAGGLLGDRGVTDDVLAKASLGGSIIVEVDRDKDGNPTAMRLVTLGSLHADVEAWDGESWGNEKVNPTYTESTWQVPLESANDRAIAGRVAAGLGLAVSGVTDTLSPVDFGALDYGGSWTQFQELAQADGFAWRQEYTVDDTTQGGSFDAAWLLKVGLSAEYTGTERRATSYSFWDGNTFAGRAGCVA